MTRLQTHENCSRQPELKQLSDRAFGGIFVFVWLAVGAWPLVHGGEPRGWALIASVLVILVTLFAPSLLSAPHKLWARLALLMHRVVNFIILAVVFYMVMLPIGLILRAFGKELLRKRRENTAISYWIVRDPPGPDPASMSNQF